MAASHSSSNHKPANNSSTETPASSNKQPPPTTLEEDDEFEDFPAEDWTEEDTDIAGENVHLWEESWDDDDTNEEFATRLRQELQKLEASKG